MADSIEKDQNNKSFITIKIQENDPKYVSRSILIQSLVDSGNRSTTLIDYNLFEDLSNNPEDNIEKDNTKIVTAQAEQYLKIVGRSKYPITMSDPEDTFKYNVYPLVIKNLQVDMVLSRNDMKNLCMTFNCHKDIVNINYQDCNLEMKLENKKTKIAQPLTFNMSIAQKTTIGKFQSKFVKVTIPELTKYHPHQAFLLEPKQMINNLASKTAVSNLKHNCLYLNFVNYNSHPVTLEYGTPCGTASIYTDEEQEQVVSLLAEDISKIIAKPRKTLSKEEMLKKFRNELDLDSNECCLDEEQKTRFCELLYQYRGAIALHDGDIGKIKGLELVLHTEGPPISSKPIPMSPPMLQQLKRQIRIWIESGIIYPCESPWSSALIPVLKKAPMNVKDGMLNGKVYVPKVRFACDYRKINLRTLFMSYPISNVQEQMAKLRAPDGRTYPFYSKADVNSAFHHIPISTKEDSQKKLAFVSYYGTFCVQMMPFGSSIFPMMWMQCVRQIQEKLIQKNKTIGSSIAIYFDDLLLPHFNKEHCFQTWKVLLEVLQEMNIKLKLAKSKVAVKKVKFLGQIVSEHGIACDPDRTAVLFKIPRPSIVSEVRRIYGLLNYYRHYIFRFTYLTRHISNLLKKSNEENSNIKWTETCQKEMLHILKEIASEKILGHPDWNSKEPFIIQTDSSRHQIGSVISQNQYKTNPITKKIELMEVPLGFASRKLTSAESRQSSYRLELNAVVTAVNHWKFYTSSKYFVIKTDNKAVAWCRKTTSTNIPHKVFRAQLFLSQFNFDIIYTKPNSVRVADAISRAVHPTYPGNMAMPEVLREEIWNNEFDHQEAATREDDDFWIKVVKRKFKPEDAIVPGSIAITTRARSKALQGSSKEIQSKTENPTNIPRVPPTDTTPTKLPERVNFDNITPMVKPDLGDMEKLDFVLMDQQKLPNKCQEYLKKQQNLEPGLKFLISGFKRTRPVKKRTIEEKIKLLYPRIPIGRLKTIQDEMISNNIYQFIHLSKKQHQLAYKNGLLCLKNNNQLRWIIPAEAWSKFVALIHFGSGSCHLGVDNTEIVAKKYFYFLHLKDFIRKFIEACKCCQDGKHLPFQKGPGLGQTSTIARKRLTFWSVDILFLPPGEKSFAHIFTCQCVSTSYLEAYPLVRATTEAVKNVLECHFFPRYGSNLTFLAHLDKQFVSQLFKDILNKYSSNIRFGLAYHAMSSPVERSHRTLLGLIRAILLQNDWPKEKWPSAFYKALTTIRMKPSNGKHSSYELVFGQLPPIQASQVMGIDLNDSRNDHDFKKTDTSFVRKKAINKVYETEAKPPVVKILEENDESILVKVNEEERKLYKFKNYFVQHLHALAITSLQEKYQSFKDEHVQKVHLKNKEYYKKKFQPKYFVPIENEIIDWRTEDPSSTSSRKLKKKYMPLFVVTQVINPYNIKIQKIDDVTFEKTGKTRNVYSGDVRPTLELLHRKRGKFEF